MGAKKETQEASSVEAVLGRSSRRNKGYNGYLLIVKTRGELSPPAKLKSSRANQWGGETRAPGKKKK